MSIAEQAVAEQVVQLKQDFDEVYGAGKQAQEDAFWDAVQDHGNRNNYNRGFCGVTWNDANFKPKYDIKPTAYSGFYSCFSFAAITDLKGILERQGITLDTSGCVGDMGQVFSNSTITRLPTIDASRATSISHMFSYANNLTYVEKLIVGANTQLSYAFGSTQNLEHIIFGGTIGQAGLDLSAATKLDRESIESIINTLSATTSGMSITLSQTAVDNAFGDGTEFSGTDGPEFNELIETKSNWTINLA